MNKRLLYCFLIILLVADIGYSFFQYLQMPLDGDMAGGIVPADDVKYIFKDPSGLSAVTKDVVYPNPNRFFAHWTFLNYFKHVPLVLQGFTDPINSAYMACAIAKIIIQVGFIVLLCFFITGKRKIATPEFLVPAVLIAPLFQTNGYRGHMGIIDPSITYTFFYALPCLLLLVFYRPFFNRAFHKAAFTNNKIILFLLVALSVFITLNGPLVPGIVLVITLLYGLRELAKTYRNSNIRSILGVLLQTLRAIPGMHLFYFSLISLLSLYSLFIGMHNSIFRDEHLSLPERFLRMPFGLFSILTGKLGFPILLVFIGINTWLINKKYRNTEGLKIVNFLKWIGLFALLYILLLPFGGYKNYRPNILRYDTIMPVTLALFAFFGMSSVFLIKSIGRGRSWYLLSLVAFVLIFTFADAPEPGKNDCEKMALQTIASSNDKIVVLKNDCTVLSWEKITDPDESGLNAELLWEWRITDQKKLYYQE